MNLLFLFKAGTVKVATRFNHDTQGWIQDGIPKRSLYNYPTFITELQHGPLLGLWSTTVLLEVHEGTQSQAHVTSKEKGGIDYHPFPHQLFNNASYTVIWLQWFLEQSQRGRGLQTVSVMRNPQTTEKSMKLNHFPFVLLEDCSVHVCCSAICLFLLSSMHQLAANCGSLLFFFC